MLGALTSDWLQILMVYSAILALFLSIRGALKSKKQKSHPVDLRPPLVSNPSIPAPASASGSDYVLAKCVVLGYSGVGKTSFVRRWVNDSFGPDYGGTIGVDFHVRSVPAGSTNIKFQVWDTAGCERYRAISRAYYRGAHVVLLMFALDDPESLVEVKRWSDEVDRALGMDADPSRSPPYKMLLGCKSDLGQAVTDEAIERSNASSTIRGLPAMVLCVTPGIFLATRKAFRAFAVNSLST
ncbi:putative ypt4 [Paratrimastix pyriformis]|uniref:Ypt4 n=1 Tax=Paratrimastix pyriformis TaxID=342808 RepID=A0ABQ8U398_9EUKA|nr:putative ypt4 [Paratrimastix pyriformis]